MLKNILKTVSTNFLLLPLGLVVGILTARYLGPSDRGLFTLLLVVPATAATFVNLGLDAAMIYLYNREKVNLSKLFINTALCNTSLGLISAGTIWLAKDFFIDRFDIGQPLYLLIVLSIIPLRMFNYALTGVVKACEDFTTYNLRTVFESILNVAGMIVVFFALQGGLFAALFVYPAILVIICSWLLLDIRKYVHFTSPDLRLIPRMLAYGVKSYAGMVAGHIHYRMDVYLVALYLTNAEIAFYAIGAHMAERILMVPKAVTMVAFPRLTRLDVQKAARLAGRLCRNMIILGVGTALVILVLGKPILVTLYGPEYLPAVGPMYVIIFGISCVAAMRTLGNFLRSINKHHYNVYIVLCAGAMNIALNFILIPRFGIMGAASSSLITYTFQAGLALTLFVRLTGLRLREILLFNREDFRYVLGLGASLRRNFAELLAR